jgi:hypothetical protein
MKLRSYIIASSGNILIQVDLSQAESWVVAFLSKEPNMKNSLMNSDIHMDTAVFFFNKPAEKIDKQTERYTAKRSNHAFSYRMSPPRFVQVYNKDAVDLGIPFMTNKQAKLLNSRWLSLYSGIPNFWWPAIEAELGKTRSLTTPYGRFREFYDSWGMELFKKATAFVPQSTVADHFMGAIQDELGVEGGLKTLMQKWGDYVINFSHDSCIADIPIAAKDDYIADAIRLIRRPLVINNEEFTIPLDVEVGERWGELEKAA